MSEDTRVYEPWPFDEVTFGKDQVIYRADAYGMYKYEVAGVEGRDAVDAAQLVIWGMAKVIVYEALTPLPDADITFVYGDFEIMRYLPVSTSKREYVLSVGGKLYAVNKYYLVDHGYAVAGESVIAEARRKGRPTGSDIPWESDDIAYVPKDGCRILRGLREGLYTVNIGSSYTTMRKEELISEGLAEDIAKKGYKELEYCSRIHWDKLKSDTGNFWNSPEAPNSLRDIARIWERLTEGEEKAVNAVLGGYDKLIEPARKVNGAYLEAEECANELLSKLAAVINKLKTFKRMCFGVPLELLDKDDQKRTRSAKSITRQFADIDRYSEGEFQSVADKLLGALDGVPSSESLEDILFSLRLLPSSSYWRARKTAYGHKREEIESACARKKQLFETGKYKYLELKEKTVRKIADAKAEFQDALDAVKVAKTRKNELDALKKELLGARRRLFPYKRCLAWSGDKLYMSNKYKITKSSVAGVYILTFNGRDIPLNGVELVYLGIATTW